MLSRESRCHDTDTAYEPDQVLREHGGNSEAFQEGFQEGFREEVTSEMESGRERERTRRAEGSKCRGPEGDKGVFLLRNKSSVAGI